MVGGEKVKFEEKAIEAIERAIEKGNGFVLLDGIMMNWLLEKLKNEPSCEEVKEAYDKGLNDAWELAGRLAKPVEYDGYSRSEIKQIWGTAEYEEVLLSTPQEALAKLKAYEEAHKIKVGDIVRLKEDPAIAIWVTNVYAYDVEGLDENYVKRDVSLSNLEKTGKHIDIQSILSQIGGE